ncbi:MAG TPA: hypothetical protein VMX56_04385 [Anaerolineales bacterium]|nr:hypothetical protein [Anaerolineales bacterium]
MPFRTEGLGVDAGLMSFIQDTKRKALRSDCWHVATKVAVKSGDHYHVSVDIDEKEQRVQRLKINRVETNGNFIIESGCENLIISDPCYIIPDKHWDKFCDKLHGDGSFLLAEPLFIEQNGIKVAVSSSGYGDGYYHCTIETDDAGNLKEAYVVFMDDEDEEDGP